MKSRFTGLVITLAGVIVALAVVDRFLAGVESAELQGTAQQSYLAGAHLLAAGKPAEAVESLREAHSVERDNETYEVALITALIDSGKTADAQPLMNEMLDREPNDGNVNLIAARLAAKEGKFADAEAYYHRAIYGEWPDNADAHRIAARMELINQLVRQGRKQELVAELISLEAEPKVSLDIRRRLAALFLKADSPARAAAIYQDIVAKNPNDIPAWEGLGEAQLDQGQYNAARAAFSQASFRDPRNAAIHAHLQMLNTVVGLDPTLRQLTSEEKYRRSVRILDMVRAALAACAPNNPLLASASAAVSAKPPEHATNEDAESVLALAEMAWRVRNDTCGSQPAEEGDVLNLLMEKLAS